MAKFHKNTTVSSEYTMRLLYVRCTRIFKKGLVRTLLIWGSSFLKNFHKEMCNDGSAKT